MDNINLLATNLCKTFAVLPSILLTTSGLPERKGRSINNLQRGVL